MKYLLKIRTSGNRTSGDHTSGDRTSGGPPVILNSASENILTQLTLNYLQ